MDNKKLASELIRLAKNIASEDDQIVDGENVKFSITLDIDAKIKKQHGGFELEYDKKGLEKQVTKQIVKNLGKEIDTMIMPRGHWTSIDFVKDFYFI